MLRGFSVNLEELELGLEQFPVPPVGGEDLAALGHLFFEVLYGDLGVGGGGGADGKAPHKFVMFTSRPMAFAWSGGVILFLNPS